MRVVRIVGLPAQLERGTLAQPSRNVLPALKGDPREFGVEIRRVAEVRVLLAIE